MSDLKVGDKVFVRGTYIGTGREGLPVVDFAPPYPSRLSLLPESIVPASAVPTEEQRAAVGRILAEREAWAEYNDLANGKTPNEQHEQWRVWNDLRLAIQDGDIAAARAVAEGGTNDR